MGLGNYINETRAEIRSVNWPTKRQTGVFTAVVVVFSLAVVGFLAFSDAIFGWLLRLVF